DIEVETKVVEADNPTYAILDESQKNYDLMVLGATETKDRKSQLFNPVVDDLVRMSPCPTIVVQANHLGDSWEPRRVLVPTNGTEEAKNAAELSFYISNPENQQQNLILHVVEEEADISYRYLNRRNDHGLKMGVSIRS